MAGVASVVIGGRGVEFLVSYICFFLHCYKTLEEDKLKCYYFTKSIWQYFTKYNLVLLEGEGGALR